MTAASSASLPDKTPIEKRPEEWDFRWVASDEEADHVYLLELTREVIREAEAQLTKPKEKRGLAALLEAMSPLSTLMASRKVIGAIRRLDKSQFIVGVMAMHSGHSGGSFGGLPPAYNRLKVLRAIAGASRGPRIGFTKLAPGKPCTPLSLGSDTFCLLKIPEGTNAKAAKADFAAWADENLPAGKVSTGGRPDLAMVKLLRLAFYRFNQAWEHPRPYAGFAVAVQGRAKDEMARASSRFGIRHYADFMDPKLNKPKAATWTEGVAVAKADIQPLVAELVAAARSLG
jgi:hypothetical protein